MKYHIEKNTVQETLVIPLFGRLICSERFPELFSDPEAKLICDSLDYDFASKRKKMESPAGLFGALEVAQRQYDLRCEAEAYLKEYPEAAVVNLGCGLDDTFRKCDNGRCRGYNIDFPDVIRTRDELLPSKDREQNIACDLNDYRWMDRIDASHTGPWNPFDSCGNYQMPKEILHFSGYDHSRENMILPQKQHLQVLFLFIGLKYRRF